MANRSPRTSILLLGCMLLAGCKLIDQRTFNHTAGRRPVPPAPPAAPAGPPPVPPLFVVQSGLPPGDWQPGLRQAVHEALARKPNVLFTVESVAPASPSVTAQAASLQAATAEAGIPVADAILADGVRPAQIELTATINPSTPGSNAQTPEVRVYVH